MILSSFYLNGYHYRAGANAPVIPLIMGISIPITIINI
jgi:hypothetical protein